MNTMLKATSPLDEWLSYLENSHFKAIDLGLERIKSVAQELDLLTPAPFVITVGGTNGKGTTCRLLETILLNAGYRVGVYSSPHLLRYNERVRIQNQELDDAEHTASFAYIEQNKTQSLTYFEFSTLSALHLFKQAKLDVVILEVGLGGRLDATNIVDNDMAVITSIDIDHTDFLGSTREQIGFEKAGIFRANKPVISQQEQGWTWQTTREDEKVRWNLLADLPLCQIPLANAATALAAVQKLPFEISLETVKKSLLEVELTGRFQTMKSASLTHLAKIVQREVEALPRMIIDVGHNPHAARYLAEKLTALKAQSQGKLIAVCGILKDKDAAGVLTPLLPLVDEWHCVTLGGYRGQEGKALLLTLRQVAEQQHLTVQGSCADSVAEGVKSAVEMANKNDTVLVFGSFHTVGEFLTFSQPSRSI